MLHWRALMLLHFNVAHAHAVVTATPLLGSSLKPSVAIALSHALCASFVLRSTAFRAASPPTACTACANMVPVSAVVALACRCPATSLLRRYRFEELLASAVHCRSCPIPPNSLTCLY